MFTDKLLKKAISVFVILTMYAGISFAQNIDPYNDGSKYAYGENVGWANFKPSQGPGVIVGDGKVMGYVWQENIGWINLSPASYGGVTYDSAWHLSGYAWGENVGWINFNPAGGGISIDSAGNFSGWAWGENIGWIHFDDTQSWNVRACVVTLEDLTNFAAEWLHFGSIPANLDLLNAVDMNDYSIFASYWQDFCPDGWQLK